MAANNKKNKQVIPEEGKGGDVFKLYSICSSCVYQTSQTKLTVLNELVISLQKLWERIQLGIPDLI